jgi:diguanylate cyclase (GGDEF)-like protein
VVRIRDGDNEFVAVEGNGNQRVRAAAAYLILETVFGRLDGSHVASTLLLTAGILGSVLACGFARKIAPRPEQAGAVEEAPWRPTEAWPGQKPGRPRPRAGTLEYEIERARRTERPLAVLAIVPDDLDFLAAGAGDSLPMLLDLVDVAIADALRAVDLVDRLGRARFRAVLPETGAENGRTVAERIRLRIDSTRPEVGGRPVGISVSIGVATFPGDGNDDVTLEAAAERALAHAQELGGNRTVLFSVPADAPRGWGMTVR